MKTRIYLLLILLFMAGRVTSQLYPVEVFLNAPMNFPANVHALSSGFGGLNLTMILRDATTVSTEVRLRFYLEKNGVRLVTGNDLLFGPISLVSNTPVVLTGVDLQTYFLPQSFQIVEGINREEFLRSGGDLPEGLYTICVEVLDFRRFMEAPLSDRVCSLTSMDLLDPPLITTPYEDQVVWVGDTLNQQPVDINWLMNYSTLIFPVDYQLSIFPYDETARTFGLGNDFFSRQPLFETYISSSTQTLNNYIFGVFGEVEKMIPGQQYVLRIQASSPDQTIYFRNQGFSDPVVFQYGQRDDRPPLSCAPAVILQGTVVSGQTYRVSWTEVEEATGYDVLISRDGALFDSLHTAATEITLSGLNPEETYQGMIRVICADGDRVTSAPFYLTTNRQLPTILFECGQPTAPLLNQNTTPIASLQPGDTIIAGDFKVRILEVTGGGGTFSGVGEMVWNFPFHQVLAPGEDPIAVNLTFDDIRINTEYFMYDGFMQVQGVGVNLVPPVLADFMREFGALDFVSDAFKQSPDLLEIDFEIGTIQVQPGSITIEGMDQEGPTGITIPWDGEDLEIFDSQGQVYVVDEQGNWTLAGELAEGGKPTNTNTSGVNAQGQPTRLVQTGVVFESGEGRYAFDQVDPHASEAERILYPATEVSGSESLYYSAYKAIRKGDEDVLSARIVGEGIDPDSLVFKTQSGRKIEHTGSGDLLTIQVRGLFSRATETILVCVKTGGSQQLVGTFRLMHLPGQEVQVEMIRLGEAIIPGGLEQTLEEIFGPVAVELRTRVHPDLPLPTALMGPDGAIDTERSSTFANYSSEQQAINQYIREQLGDAYRDNTYYLIFTGAPSSTGLAGYMPLSRQFGYLFSEGDTEVKNNQATTAAHELGHGIFGLEHPFSRFGIPLGSTDWLMDYSQGAAIPHIHWAQMYDPEFRLYLFQRDEEGEQIVASEAFIYANYIYFANSEKPGENFGALTPSGQRYILPAEAVAAFYPESNHRWPQGALAGFRLETSTYYGWWSKENQTFLGYAPGSLKDDYGLQKSGDYHPGLKEQPVPVFAGLNGEDCMQQIVWQESNRQELFSQPAKIALSLPLEDFDPYQSAEVAQTNCGCYQGECREFLETHRNHPYLTTDNILKRVICANPCVLKDFEQFPFFDQPTTEWMENLNNICAAMLAFGFSPAVLVGVGTSAEGILGPILRGIAAQSAGQLAYKFTIGSTLDMLLQTGINYYFPDEEPITWQEARDQVDMITCIASGVEATLLLQTHLEEAVVAAVISCFIDGALEEGKIREDFDVSRCAQGAVSALAIQGALQISKVGYEKLKRLPPDRLIGGFLRLFNTTPPGTYASGFTADGPGLWTILDFLRPDPMPTSYIKNLFKITDDALAADLLEALEDPIVRADLLESGYFLKIFNLDLPSEVKDRFVRDLLDSKAFRDLVRENEGVVRVWEGMVNAPSWARLNTDLIESIYEESDDVIETVGYFYSTTMKNQTPAGFNGGEKYYGGVWFNKYGFPDFEKLNQTIGRRYNFNGARGNYDTDFADARDWLKKQEGIEAIDDYNGTGSPLNVKLAGRWVKITWHHHEDGKSLIPVYTDIHTGLSHSGGVKTVELGINHIFSYL